MISCFQQIFRIIGFNVDQGAMRIPALIHTVACLLATAFFFSAQAQERKLTPGEVPAIVIAAASKQFPDARVSQWSQEREHGKTTYEASTAQGSVKRDVVFAEDGSLVAIEEAVAVSSLPGAVTQSIHSKYPKASILKAEKITHGSDVQYEVALQHAAKKEVLLTATGHTVKEP